MNNFGADTRRDQIEKWRAQIEKNTNLLLAFPVREIEREEVARHRAQVAQKIQSLSLYLASGEWTMFCEGGLTYPHEMPTTEAEVVEDAEVLNPEQNDATPLLPGLLPAPEDEAEAEAGDMVPQGEVIDDED